MWDLLRLTSLIFPQVFLMLGHGIGGQKGLHDRPHPLPSGPATWSSGTPHRTHQCQQLTAPSAWRRGRSGSAKREACQPLWTTRPEKMNVRASTVVANCCATVRATTRPLTKVSRTPPSGFRNAANGLHPLNSVTPLGRQTGNQVREENAVIFRLEDSPQMVGCHP